MSASTFKSSINVKSVGSPQKFIAKKDLQTGQVGLFATIYGVANGVVKRADAKDPDKFYYGLKGTFEAIDSDGGDAIGSSALFAPDAIHDKIAQQLLPSKDTATGKEIPGASAVSFAFEAYVRAGGTAGFTWEYKFVQQGEPEEEDILASVRKLINPKAVQIEPPKDAPTESHSKSKGKGA